MPRVFLTEPPRRYLDTSSAEAFGDMQFLFNDGDRRSSILNSEMYVSDVYTQLRVKCFDPAVDLFCVAGGMLNVSQALIALTLFVGARPMQLLLFNSSTGLYEQRTIHTSGLLAQE